MNRNSKRTGRRAQIAVESMEGRISLSKVLGPPTSAGPSQITLINNNATMILKAPTPVTTGPSHITLINNNTTMFLKAPGLFHK